MNTDLPATWTAIAEKLPCRTGQNSRLVWRELTDAPVTIRDAHLLFRMRLLLMATRVEDDVSRLMVKAARYVPGIREGAR